MNHEQELLEARSKWNCATLLISNLASTYPKRTRRCD